MKFTKEELIRQFDIKYIPYLVDDYEVPELRREDIPLDEENPMLRDITYQVDQKRKEDIYVGVKGAGREIYANLIQWLNTEQGVNAALLFAVLGSMGGRECMHSIMTSVDAMAHEHEMTIEDFDALDIYFVKGENGEKYLRGPRVDSLFMSFYSTAAEDENISAAPLVELGTKLDNLSGSDYWEVPEGSGVEEDPCEIADMMNGRFEGTFDVYCRFPYERMLSVALAVQLAVKECAEVLPKDVAMRYIREYGWRTAHYIGK